MLREMDAITREKYIANVGLTTAETPAPWTPFRNVIADDAQEVGAWMNSEWYSKIFKYYAYNMHPRHMTKVDSQRFARVLSQYRLHNHRLLHQLDDQWIPCILETEVAETLRQMHDGTGHFAADAVISRLRYKAYWPTLTTDVVTYIKGCMLCAKYGPKTRTRPLSPIEVLEPFTLVGMDYIGPLDKTPQGNKYILHLIDYFSRFSYAIPTADNGSITTVKHLKEVFARTVDPIAIYSDSGSHFESSTTQEYLRSRGIMWIARPSSISKPTGMIERANGLLQKAMEKSTGFTKENWDEFVLSGNANLNCRHIKHLGYSPVEILYGMHDVLPFQRRTQSIETAALRSWFAEASFIPPDETGADLLVARFIARRENARTAARGANSKYQQKAKERYDRGVKRAEYKKGDLVMLYDPSQEKQKLVPKWRGPFVVDEPAGDHGNSFRIRALGDRGQRFRYSYHGDHLKKFAPRTGRLATTDEPVLLIHRRLRRGRGREETVERG